MIDLTKDRLDEARFFLSKLKQHKAAQAAMQTTTGAFSLLSQRVRERSAKRTVGTTKRGKGKV